MQAEKNPIIKFEIDESGFSEFAENEEFSSQAIEVEILPPVDINDPKKVEIYHGIDEIDKRLSVISARVDELNSEIDSLTNHADGIDYREYGSHCPIVGFVPVEFRFYEFVPGQRKYLAVKVIDSRRKEQHCADHPPEIRHFIFVGHIYV